MATYNELFTINGNNVLLDRITVAIAIAADKVLNEASSVPGNAARRVWAHTAFNSPGGQAKAFQHALLAANSSATVAGITGASDSVIQTAVDAAVDIFAGV